MGRLLCIGDLNADIAIVPDGEIAAGSDTDGRVELATGGSAANVAAGAASSGTPTRFVGVVGDDLLGAVLVDSLRRDGVDVEPIVRIGANSRAIAAMIAPNGERSMVSDLAAGTSFRIDDIDPRWFDDVDWIHLTAYTWFPPGGDEVFARIVGLASELGIAWSVDPSSAQMLESMRTSRDAVAAFDGAAVIFPNHEEATMLTGADDPADAATQLLEIAETAVVTCGASGVVVAARHAPLRRCPAHDALVVNTLGAGDAFAAGFIAARVVGRDDEAATEHGLVAAAHAVARATAR